MYILKAKDLRVNAQIREELDVLGGPAPPIYMRMPDLEASRDELSYEYTRVLDDADFSEHFSVLHWESFEPPEASFRRKITI